MRNLPEVSVIVDDSANNADTIDLKHWQAQANSEDLYSLFLGEVTNNTHYEFHDLFFTLHYKQYSARFFRKEMLRNFIGLVNAQVGVEEIRTRAAAVDAEEEQAKADIAAMIKEMRAARAAENTDT